jgi:hypothetical protein
MESKQRTDHRVSIDKRDPSVNSFQALRREKWMTIRICDVTLEVEMNIFLAKPSFEISITERPSINENGRAFCVYAVRLSPPVRAE